MKTLRQYEVPFRGGASSHRFNQAMGQVETDLSAAYESLLSNNIRLVDLAKTAGYINQATRTRVADLEFLVYMLGYYSTTDKVLGVSMYNPAGVSEGTSAHDPIYGELTLPYVANHSKLPIYEDFNGFQRVIPQVSVSVAEEGGAYVAQDRGTTAYNPLDRYLGDAWLLESDTPPSPVNYRVTYPTPTNPAVNMLTVDLIPEGLIKITDLTYTNQQASYVTIPGFTEQLISWRYHFKAVDVLNGIDVELSDINEPIQLVNLSGEGKYVYGMSNLMIQYAEHQSTSWAVTQMSADSIEFITSLEASAELNTGDGTPVTDAVRIQVYTGDQADWENPSGGDLVYDSNVDAYPYDSSQTPIDTKVGGVGVGSIWVKWLLTRVQDTTPVVRGIRITYTGGS
jgi:hypothetical protein